ncbi:hypothetical protein X801_07307, partial [Opisthorchis viverrini]
MSLIAQFWEHMAGKRNIKGSNPSPANGLSPCSSDLPPLRGSRCSLNDYSAEIGSDADGELDDYNLDP